MPWRSREAGIKPSRVRSVWLKKVRSFQIGIDRAGLRCSSGDCVGGLFMLGVIAFEQGRAMVTPSLTICNGNERAGGRIA
eukprot:346214-Amphidinium_carterae.1